MTQGSGIPAGWYPTADGQHWRWHDGTNWTEHLQPRTETVAEPVAQTELYTDPQQPVTLGQYPESGTTGYDQPAQEQYSQASYESLTPEVDPYANTYSSPASDPYSTGTTAATESYDDWSATSTESHESPTDPYSQSRYADPNQDPYATQAVGAQYATPVNYGGRRRALKLIPLIAVPLILVGGGAFAAYQFGVFGAPGSQPSAAAPTNTIAYVALDLNPSAKAKLGAFKFIKNFRVGKDMSEDTISEDFADKLFTQATDGSLSYETDIEPWLGRRVGLALMPTTSSLDGITPLVLIEQTDEEATIKALTKMDKKSDTDDPMFWAFKDDYVIIGSTQATVDSVANAEKSLEDNKAYVQARDALGEDTIAQAWFDGNAISDLAGPDLLANVDANTQKQLKASIVVGVTVTGQALEIAGHRFGPAVSTETGKAAHAAGLPGDADLAFEITGLGNTLKTAWPQLAASDLYGIGSLAKDIELKFPENIPAVFGSDFAASFRVNSDKPHLMMVVTSKSPEKVVKAFNKHFGPEATKAGLPHKVAVTDFGYTASFGEPGQEVGSLTDQPGFKKAVPNPSKAQTFLYLNLPPLLEAATADDPTAKDSEWYQAIEPLQAIGYSGVNDGEYSSFALRFTLKG